MKGKKESEVLGLINQLIIIKLQDIRDVAEKALYREENEFKWDIKTNTCYGLKVSIESIERALDTLKIGCKEAIIKYRNLKGLN